MFEANATVGAIQNVNRLVFAVNATFWGFPNVIYVAGSPEAYCLVDTGIAQTPNSALHPLFDEGWRPSGLKFVFITHHHVDHAGGASAVRTLAPNARIVAGAADCVYIQNPVFHVRHFYESGMPNMKASYGDSRIRKAIGGDVAVDRPIYGGEVFKVGQSAELETIYLGGHTRGQVAYLERNSGCCFVGDALQGCGVLNGLTGLRDFPLYEDVRAYRQSLDSIGRLRPNAVATSHSGIYHGNELDVAIETSRTWIDWLDSCILDLARSRGRVSLSELIEYICCQTTEYEDSLSMRITLNAHLVNLTSTRRLEAGLDRSGFYWTNADNCSTE